jgi:hypothetical protein
MKNVLFGCFLENKDLFINLLNTELLEFIITELLEIKKN